VRAVAESHGGSVSAGQSTYGGARFSVRLPLEKATDRTVETDSESRSDMEGRASAS
jgi:K+-sensing histidine kinase KdpD